MDENERQRRARLRMKKRRRQVLIGRTIVALLLVILAALCVFVVRDLVEGKSKVTRGKPRSAAVPGTESQQQRANPKAPRRPRRKPWM